MGKQKQLLKRYMPGLDGLRAISVLAVIAYHFNLKWAKGGLLGVEVFFVLSGYLITDQLLWELKTQRKISLWHFWIRRIRRLLPAMVSMLMVVALVLILIDPSRMQTLKGDFISSVFYVNNWYLIFHQVSYFESFGPPSPIGHLWSLSIEEQFYVIWPLLLFFLVRLLRRQGKLAVFILLGAAVSVIAMALLYVPGTDPSRVYYGTDTRAFAILIGAALAVVWPSWRLTDRISSGARSLLDLLGAVAMLILFIMMNQTNEYDSSLYPVGFLFLSVVTAVIIAVLVHPASQLGAILAAKPLSWIGKRSYSLYIWHYPVIILSSPEANVGEPGFVDILLQLTLIFMLSALSYRFVEEPIRRGRLWWTRSKELNKSTL
ncbi:acyltransferase family protein [Paenibacillus chitinolyticus]|uniref:acyltransferase family protein n=1 Tax=Paenibacillus chitinolyticus TaxID=79263 RepID=UPI001C491030|nr:acyltransferase [Paenibacillus chitinolyticus]MBV6715140.1 acyltransferase [Paenibacillus chitinolyticus]